MDDEDGVGAQPDAQGAVARHPRCPHIVIFNPDQFRGDALAHMGNPAALTPNLDALAATDGVSFRNAFVQATVCTPSRCSFMSGWYPHVRGHRTMFHMMHEDEPVLLRTLKEAGYWVWWGGKNDLTPGKASPSAYCDVRYEPRGPFRNNVYRNENWRGPADGDGYYSFYVGRLDDGTSIEGGPASAAADGGDGDGERGPSSSAPLDGDWSVVNAAVDVILEHRRGASPTSLASPASLRAESDGAPICLFLALGFPHPPYGVEDPFYKAIDRSKVPERLPTPTGLDGEGMAGEAWDGKPAILKEIWQNQGMQGWSEERWTELRATYYGQCARIDHQFGLIVAALKQAGIYDDTAIFFFSDHGDYTGDYGLVEKNQNTFEECLTRTPLLVKPPAWVPAKPGISDALVELVDFSATVEELCGLTATHTHFGRSLLRLISGETCQHKDAVFAEGGRAHGETHCMELESTSSQAPEGLYYPRLSAQKLEGPYHTKATMVRTATHKHVQRLYESDELYDLREDPGELRNRIDDPDLAGILAQLKDRLLRFYLETSDVVPHKTDPRW